MEGGLRFPLIEILRRRKSNIHHQNGNRVVRGGERAQGIRQITKSRQPGRAILVLSYPAKLGENLRLHRLVSPWNPCAFQLLGQKVRRSDEGSHHLAGGVREARGGMAL